MITKKVTKTLFKSEDQERNTPYLIYTIMFINVFFYSMSSTVVFSFLPKMVRYFGVDELNTGLYAGIVGSSLHVGRLCFSLLWGYASDTIGKRKSAALTGIVLTITTFAFWFSRTFYWAAITRFLQGCSMGQIIVNKALARIVCDDKSIFIGISVVMTAFTAGTAFGPGIGGFLVFPADLYPNIFAENGIFDKFPFLLPNVIICFGLMLGVGLTLKFVPDDNNRKSSSGSLLNSTDKINSYGAITDRKIEIVKETKVLPTGHKYELVVTSMKSLLKESSVDENGTFKPSISIALYNKECIISAILFCLFAIVDIGFKEMFPIYSATIPKYKGLGFSSSDIGTILMVVTLILPVFQLTFLPKLNERYGSKVVLVGSTITSTFLMPMLPSTGLLNSRIAAWTFLGLIFFLVQAMTFLSYHSINIFVNNSVGPDLVGLANGVSMTFASLGRLASPTLCGAIYSWSLTNINGVKGNEDPLGFPFNQYLAFFFLSLWAILVAVITSRLPDSMNSPKK